jgi:hypothetical protein
MLNSQAHLCQRYFGTFFEMLALKMKTRESSILSYSGARYRYKGFFKRRRAIMKDCPSSYSSIARFGQRPVEMV